MSSEVVWDSYEMTGVPKATLGKYVAGGVVSQPGAWGISRDGDGHSMWVEGDRHKIERILRALNGEPDPRVAELEARVADQQAIIDAALRVVGGGNAVLLPDSIRESLAAREAEAGRMATALRLIAACEEGCGGNLTFEEMKNAAVKTAIAALAEPARERDGGGE